MVARVSQVEGQKADLSNFLLMMQWVPSYWCYWNRARGGLFLTLMGAGTKRFGVVVHTRKTAQLILLMDSSVSNRLDFVRFGQNSLLCVY